MRLVNRLSVLALASALPLAACGGGEDGGPDPVVCDPTTYQDYTFVVDSVQLPTTPAEATQLALDLDGAEPIRADNTLGMVIATLADQANLDVTTAVTGAINAGDVILLSSLQTDSLAGSACARLGVYLGANPSVPPCVDVNDTVCGGHLQGDASFEIAQGSPTDTKIDGQILPGGQFELGDNPPGNFVIEIDIAELGQPLALNLIGARVETTVSEGELTSGLIGGAITEADLQNSILPAIHGVIADVVTADCGGAFPDCCTPGSAGEQVLGIFDADDSCDVTLEELTTNELISALLAPDVDLLNANGEFSPNEDGIADSLSIGLGFTATTGTFTIP